MNARTQGRAIRPTMLLLTCSLVAALFTACSMDGPTDLVDRDGSLTTAAKPDGVGGGNGGGGGDDGGGTSEPTAEVTITTVVAGAGLYSDGGGTYSGAFNDGDLWVHASCEESRKFVLDLTAQGLPAPFTATVEGCGFPPRLTIEAGLIGASVGDVLGKPVPAGSTNMGDATNYYFADPDGTTYNVIWQGGICVHSVTDNGDGTTTYGLSTDPVSSACAVDLAEQADLVRRKTKGKPGTEPVAGDGSVIAHLDLEVRVIPAP